MTAEKPTLPHNPEREQGWEELKEHWLELSEWQKKMRPHLEEVARMLNDAPKDLPYRQEIDSHVQRAIDLLFKNPASFELWPPGSVKEYLDKKSSTKK